MTLKTAKQLLWSGARYAAILAVLVLSYFVTGKFGLSLAFTNQSTSLVWPPAGIALAALLLFGYRYWPAVFLGAFWVNATTAGSAVSCAAIAAGNTLEALAAAYLINRYTGGGPRIFDRAQNILRFAVLAGVVSTAVAATAGTLTLCLSGLAEWSTAGVVWSTWWLGDMMGVFVVTPLIVLWALPTEPRRGPYQFFETCFLLVFLLGASIAVFGGFFSYVNYYPLSFVCLPFVIWSVFRLSQREAVTAIFLISAVAIGATTHGLGPFARQTPGESLWILQVFLSAVTVIALTLITMVVERRRAEAALKASEEKFRLVVDASPVAMAMLDREGRVLLVNTQMEKLFGYTRRELIGRSVNSLIPERFAAAAESRRFFRDARGLRKDGTEFPLEAGLNPIRTDSGVLIMASIVDTTERMRRETDLKEKLEAIERLNAAMEHSNLELARRQATTLSLLSDLQDSKSNLEKQRQSLQEANQKLKQLSAVKDEFVSTVSHELRTPLAVIKEGVELVLDQILGELNDEQKDFLSTVNENIDRLTYLINNILDLSKIEAGRVSLVRRKTRVKPLIKTVVHNSRLMLARRTIEIEPMVDYDVFADPERTMQVLQNLFVNAIKFTAEDGVISFRTRRLDGRVEISVKDDGVGIAQEDLPKMFKKFSQVGDTKNRPKGTGLGLALAKQLVELQKGEIDVHSEKGKGTEFTFTLPLYSGDLALEEHFRDETVHGENRRLAVVVFDARPFLRPRPDAGPDAEERALDDVVDHLRRRLYSSTPVFSCKPYWIVTLVVEDKDAKDFQSFLGPLRETLHAFVSSPAAKTPVFVNFGVAVHPADGADPHALFAKAVEQAQAPVIKSP